MSFAGEEEIMVMKQVSGVHTRYRYRIQGIDYGVKYLNSIDAFKFKYSTNMTELDKLKVQEQWKDKLILTDGGFRVAQ